MPSWDNLPITKSVLVGSSETPGPPPISQEWRKACGADQDSIVFVAGNWHRAGDHIGWTALWVDNPGAQEPLAVATPAASIERLLAPIAHEARARLMQALHAGPKSSGELSAATGLKGGNLYYHLRELLHAAYVKEVEGGYDLTPLGAQLLILFAAIADSVVKDRGEAGLLVEPPGGEAA